MQLIRIWLSTPVGIWHYARTPEYDYSQMTPEQARLVLAKWHSVRRFPSSDALFPALTSVKWYSADWDYSLATVYLFCVSVAFFGLINIVFRLRQRAGCVHSWRYCGSAMGLIRGHHPTGRQTRSANCPGMAPSWPSRALSVRAKCECRLWGITRRR